MTERTDRELLEMAAKASGEWPECWHDSEAYFTGVLSRWNPLEDDGDALRLAVGLSLHVKVCRRIVCIEIQEIGDDVVLALGDDPYAATRRAIVRAAAAMAEGGEQ